MSKMDYLQIQVMQLLSELNGEPLKDGAKIDLQLQELVKDFHKMRSTEQEQVSWC